MSAATESTLERDADAPEAARYNLILLQPIARWCRATLGQEALRRLCDESGVQLEWFAESNHWVSWRQYEAVLAAARARVASDEEFAAVTAFEYAEILRHVRLLNWAITPSQVYRAAERLGGFFSTAGRFTFLGATRNSARLRWTSACRESRLVCLGRQACSMQAPTLWGMPPAHVREHKCIARGDDCCEYEFYWQSRPRPLAAVLGAVAGLAGMWSLAQVAGLPPLVPWTIPLFCAAAGYLYEFRRVARANTATQTEIADSFRDVIAGAAEAHCKVSDLEERLRAAERAAARVDSFVGRERELDSLVGALQDASAGRVRLILVSGEPGIGKTRLAEECAGNAQCRGARVLVGRCPSGEGVPPLWPWVQVLRSALRSDAAAQSADDLGIEASEIAQLVPEVRQHVPAGDPGGLEPSQARFHLFDAVVNFLHRLSTRELLVVVLDDLQWAHRPTLLLLQFLMAQLRDARLLVIGTYRDGELGPGDTLTQVLPDLVREPGCESVALSGLTREQLAPLIAGITGAEARGALIDAVYSITEGNPFFTREVVRLLASEGNLQIAGGPGSPRISLPQSLREVVRRRLGRLSADCNQLLDVGAVLGRDFVLDRAGLVTTLDRARLIEVTEEALAARVIRAAPDRERVYSFAHAVIREALYEGIPASRRAEIHSRIAIALEEVADGEPAGMAELAHHYSEAAKAGGALDKAVEYSRRAADVALRFTAYEDAVRSYQRALDLLAGATPPDERLRCELLLALGEAQMRAGDAPAAREQSLRAAALARRLGLPTHFANAALGFGWWFRIGGVDNERIALLTEALGQTADADSALKAKLMARLAAALYWIPDTAERRADLSAEAVAMARRIQDSATLAFALNARLYAVWVPESAELGLTTSRELLQLAESASEPELALQSRQWIVADLMQLGDVESAYREMAIHARQAEALHEPLHLWLAAVWRSMRALLEGRFSEVETLAAEVLALGRQSEPTNAEEIYFDQIFWLRREQGRLNEFAEIIGTYAGEHATFGAAYACALALTHAELGRESATRLEFARLVACGFSSLRRDLPLGWLTAIAAAAEACCFLNDPHAADLYEILLPFARRIILTGMAHSCLGPGSRYLGLLATTLRRWPEAEQHFIDALAMLERLRARPLLARTQHDFARMLLARDAPGDHARALELLGTAVAAARQLGMPSLLDKAVALQAAVAADKPSQAADPPTASTPAPAAGPDDMQEGTRPGNAIFRHEGEYWSITWEGAVSRLRDAKGLHYIAQLLRHPGEEFHARDLMALVGNGAVDAAPPSPVARTDQLTVHHGLGNAGALLDVKAKGEYKRRLDDLREELEEAERCNDPGRVDRARKERAFITDQLAAAIGLRGRDRVAGSDAERARLAVTKRIKAALVKIHQANPALARHLTTAITTGYFCCYAPTMDVLTSWVVG